MSRIVNLSSLLKGWWLVGGRRQGYMVPCYVIQTVRVQVIVDLGGERPLASGLLAWWLGVATYQNAQSWDLRQSQHALLPHYWHSNRETRTLDERQTVNQEEEVYASLKCVSEGYQSKLVESPSRRRLWSRQPCWSPSDTSRTPGYLLKGERNTHQRTTVKTVITAWKWLSTKY